MLKIQYEKFRRRLFQTLGLAVLLTVGFVLYDGLRLIRYEIPESYAAWTAGNLLVEYLRKHNNQWPRNWDDLRSVTNSVMMYCPLEQLPRRVKIAWDFNPQSFLEKLKGDTNLGLYVVTRPDGLKLSCRWGNDTEPNGRLVQYLISSLSQTNSSTSLTP